MKEQNNRSRPTSSSSTFMHVNPLIGVGQKYAGLRFQPLDEEIIEENLKKGKKLPKNKRKKTKNKKKLVMKRNEKSDDDHMGT